MAYSSIVSTGIMRFRQNKLLEDGTLKIANDLSDLNSSSTARTNLDVYSKSEVSSLVATNSGTFYSVADITARDALTPASGDRVYVADNGDTKWAIYQYAGSAWRMLADQDQYTAALTKVNVPVQESLTVSSDQVVLTDSPYGDILISEPVLTFGDGTKELIEVSQDGADATGKTWTLTPPSTGDWDSLSVKVTYIKQVDTGVSPQ